MESNLAQFGLNLDHQHVHLRLLAPDGVDRTAHGALDRAGDNIGVAPLAGRQALEGLKDRIVDQRVNRRAFARRSGRPAIITSGSPAISPLAVSAIAIETTPAKLSLRRWPTHC